MKSLHFWNIHKRVALRLWGDLPQGTRDAIASDSWHIGETYKWFESKVLADALRLYEDPEYWANDQWTFRVSKG